ncbi:MAG: LD-carboxypeptidase [Rubrivivax sp.]
MLSRRAWLAAAAGALGGCATVGGTAPLLRPPRLRPGDTVGLFGSGTRLAEDWIAQAVANVESIGLRPKLGRHVRAAHGHYSGTVAQRVDDLHQLWADPEVRALWSIRGGAGTAQLLPHLDYAAMRRTPKAVIGYSDATALHLALLRHAGLVCFHGPAGVSTFTPFSVDQIRAVLMDPQPRLTLERAPSHRLREADEPQFRARTVRGGGAEGPLLGGNLSVLSALVGTPWGPRTDGALLLLEDIGELPYRVDRMLTQLELAGLLRASAGLVGGVFENCEAPPDASPRMPLADVIDARFGSAGVPAVYGLSFGHVRDQLTLPLGVRARLDADALTLTLLEPAVS